MPNVLAIAGSPAHPSRSYAVLDYAQSILKLEGLTTDLLSVRDISPKALLHAQFDHTQIQHVVNQVEQANALMISTPVYKASFSGILKTFLDILPQNALIGKPVLPVVTGSSMAHLLTIDYALKPVLAALGAKHILSGVYLIDNQVQWGANGGIWLEEDVEHRLQSSVYELIATIRPAPVALASLVASR